jgi:hypothetical protein
MARGAPDYRVSSSLYGQTSTDVFELAARMGYSDNMDRRGSVIFIDNFNNLLIPYTLNAAAASWCNVVAKPGCTYMGDHVLCCPGVSTFSYQFWKYVPIIQHTCYGFECAFGWEVAIGTTAKDIDFYINFLENGQQYQFAVEVNVVAANITIYTRDSGGVTTHPIVISGLGVLGLADRVIWHYMKLVVDLETRKYKRLIFDDYEIDLSIYPGYYIGSAATPTLNTYIVTFSGANTADVYIGNWIITMNEP